MMIIKKTRRMHLIPMSSLADVAFLLLIFLILTSAVNLNEEQELTIPTSKQARPIQNKRAFEITVTERGTVSCQGRILTLSELQTRTLQEFSRFPLTVFFIKADENAYYKEIDPVIHILKKNHIQNVVIMAHKQKPKQ